MALHCERCGKEVSTTARFCPSCGSPITAAGKNQAPVQPDRWSTPAGASAPQPSAGTGGAFGVAAVILGAVTFGVQLLAGLCCGWISWPLMIAAVVCGILAIQQGQAALGWLGIGLSVAAVLLQIIMLMVGAASLSALLSQMG